MKRKLIGLSRRVIHDQKGQSLVLMAVMLVSLLAFAGFVIDFGHVYYSYHELQSSTAAAAMAGAQGLSTSGTAATTLAAEYSAQAGDKNYQSNLTVTSFTATLGCVVATVGASVACITTSSGTKANAIQITQTATVHSYIMGMFGIPSVTLTSTASALMRGGSATPYNIAFVVDATESMQNPDDNCGTTTTSSNTNGSSDSTNPYLVYAAYKSHYPPGTGSGSGGTTSVSRFQCMQQGIQTFLEDVAPCASSGCGTTDASGDYVNAVDKVSIFSFPEPSSSTQAEKDYTCGDSTPSISPYNYPSSTGTSYDPGTGATYQITPFMDNYQTTSSGNATGTLSTSTGSYVSLAAGAKSGCGMSDPGGEGTYYAGAIYAAMASLLAEQAAEKAEGIYAQNVMIITSDGEATASKSQMSSTGLTNNGVYPSDVDECEQAVVAAQAAAAAGIKVYTIAYGAQDSGCSTDTTDNAEYQSPCYAMQQMASSPTLFYSDNDESGVTSDCESSNSFSSMTDIFTNIANTGFTSARLIPNSTWPSS